MTIDEDEIDGIAKLSKLEVDAADKSALANEISSILSLFEQLNRLDTDGISPMAHPLDMVQRLRPDVVTETNQREQLQMSAPSVSEGLYLVPKVID